MYDFMRQNPTEIFTGVYYEKAPTIPMTERGKVFKYARPNEISDENANVVTNLEYRREQTVIRTTAQNDWKPETYVVLGDELWRIIRISKRYIESLQGAMIRKPLAEYTLTLDLCNNSVGVKRV